jgi:TonB family protein
MSMDPSQQNDETATERKSAKSSDFSRVDRDSRRLWVALIASAFLHVLVGSGWLWSPRTEPPPSRLSEVELLSPEQVQALLAQAEKPEKQRAREALGKQIVEIDEKQRLNNEKDPNSRFLSAYDQKVIKQMKASKVAKFENSGGKGLAPNNGAQGEQAASPTEAVTQKESARSEKEVRTSEQGDLAIARPSVNPKLAAFQPNFRKLPHVPDPTRESAEVGGDEQKVSATDDRLKDVETGMQTMLSTREFVYYSYYNRIKDRLRQYWEPKIKEKFERSLRQGRRIASVEGDKITKLIIVLDAQGTLMRVQMVSRSGVSDLDEAAVDAFRAAAPFPNPPAGIVEEDGTIKIRWDFVIEA